MAQSDDESSELAELQRRVYGPESRNEPASDSDIERLRELESRRSADPAATHPPAIGEQAEEPDGSRELETDSRPNRFGYLSWRGWLLVSGSAFALAMLGFGIGTVAAAPSGLEVISEFTIAQSEEDIIPTSFIAGTDVVDPASTRFIARIDGYEVFLGQPKGGYRDGVCIVTYRLDQPPGDSTLIGCGSGSTGSGGMGANVSSTLDIAYGEPGPHVTGSPIRLSENVTAYLH